MRDIAKAVGMLPGSIYYHFPSKDDLISEVIVSMGSQLQATLAPAFAVPAADHVELARAAWPVLAHPDADPVFALSDEQGTFEIADLAPGLWNMEIRGAGYLPVRAPASLYGEIGLRAVLVDQPATYEPQPLDLMPPEEPIPPREPMAADAQANAAAGGSEN